MLTRTRQGDAILNHFCSDVMPRAQSPEPMTLSLYQSPGLFPNTTAPAPSPGLNRLPQERVEPLKAMLSKSDVFPRRPSRRKQERDQHSSRVTSTTEEKNLGQARVRFPGSTKWKERIHVSQLSSDPHMLATANTHMHRHTHGMSPQEP